MKKITWNDFFTNEFQAEYFINLQAKVDLAYQNNQLFPDKSNLYRAFELCSLETLKVVILGQDPYHNEGQANGLAFSVNKGVKLPPSLRNIFLEIKNEFNVDHSQDEGYSELLSWTQQGVLLLNDALTVKKHEANSCADWGWKNFSQHALEFINEHKQNVVFVGFGTHGKKTLEKLHLKNNNIVLTAVHPSPLSAYRGFFNSQIFKKINDYLTATHQKEINW